MLKPLLKRTKYAIYAGNVVKTSRCNRKDKEFYIITLCDYKNNRGEFWFASSKVVEKYKFDRGEFVIIKSHTNPFCNSSYTALKVCRKGMLSILENGKIASVVIGTVFSPKTPKPDLFTLSMPLREKQKDGTFVDTWYTISFFNGSMADPNSPSQQRKWFNAEYAAKAMGNRKQAKAAILVGQPQHHVYKDRMYHTFIGTTMIRAND